MENKPKQQLPTPEFPKFNSWFFMTILFLGLTFLLFFNGETSQTITSKRFIEDMLKQGDVAKIEVVNEKKVEVYIKPESLGKPQYNDAPKGLNQLMSPEGPHYYFTIGSVEVFHKQLEEAQQDIPTTERVDVVYKQESDWIGTLLSWLLPLGLLMLFWVFMLRRATGMKGMGNSVFSFGKSRARELNNDSEKKITFKDVAGLEEAKEEIYELVKFLKDPGRYNKLGAKIPKGVLLVGPPGTGKTLLAKAVAGEANVPFFSLSGSEFIEMFVGVGAARMRDLFEKAKAKSPSIIFIDEIDTVGRARGKVNAFQSNDERESTLNQLLAELDGFGTDTGVIVLAATNRGDVLDPALLRPGRFDRHIHLELPNLKERTEVFKVHMRPLTLAPNVDLEILSGQTPGFSGADIANICNEAALIAVRNEKEAVEMEDFMNAIDRVIGGLERRSKIISPEEKKRIAYHEAGHVTASWFLEHASPVLKVSIIPRGKSLGAAWYLPEEHQIITRSEFEDAICTALGGRAAEELFFEEVSSNALDDLEKVTKQAYSMVMIYGLSDEIRNLSYYDSTGQAEQSLHKPYSEKTAERIDAEVQKIVDDVYAKTKSILWTNKDRLEALAGKLIKKEVVYKAEIKGILGNRKVANPSLRNSSVPK